MNKHHQVAKDLTPDQISTIKNEIYEALHFLFNSTLPETENISLNPNFWSQHISVAAEKLLFKASKGEVV